MMVRVLDGGYAHRNRMGTGTASDLDSGSGSDSDSGFDFGSDRMGIGNGPMTTGSVVGAYLIVDHTLIESILENNYD